MATRDKTRARWSGLNRRSANRGKACCSLEEFRAWYESQERRCNYCGIEEEFLRLYCTRIPSTATLHVDRIVNSKGYMIGNMRLACYPCNSIIKAAKTEEFVSVVVKAILKNGMLDEYHLWNVPSEKREAACGWRQFTFGEKFQRGRKEVTRIYQPNEFHYMGDEEISRRINSGNTTTYSGLSEEESAAE